MSKGDFRFHFPLRVRWSECDRQGIAFNGSYLTYLEVAQAEYYRNLGFSIYQVAERGYFDTATVKVLLEYKAPARVEELLDIYTRVSRIGATSITMEVEIYREASDVLLTTIQAVYAGYDSKIGATKPVPPDLRQVVEHFEATGEALPIARFPNLGG